MANKTAPLHPVYLIVSEQELLVDQALTRLIARVGESADLDFNMQSFSGESLSADEVIASANTLPFASDLRLVIVKDIERVNKDGLNALADYAASPSPTTVLALVGSKLAKNTRLYKAVDKLGGVLERKFEKRDAPGIVRSMFEKAGKTISLDNAGEMVSAVGLDLRKLSVEVDKAVSFVGDRKEVTSDDIEAVTLTTAPTTVWEFVEALGDRDATRALATCSALIGEGESVFGLHALAVRSIRDLIAVRSLLDRGMTSAGEIARSLGRQEWQMKRTLRQARGFESEELVDAIRAAAESEAQMKTSRDSRLVFERWILKVCR